MRLDPTFETTVRDAIERVSNTWARSIPIPIHLDLSSLELVERDPFFRSLGSSVCVGRSPFVSEGIGIGGWILPEPAADRLARGLLSLPPPPAHGVATFGGPIDEGIQILHTLFLEGWNQGIPNRWRINDDISLRRAERLWGLGTRDVTTPVYPWVLPLDFEIAGQFYQLGIILSPALTSDPDPSYTVPSTVASWIDGTHAPVAFVDPTGTVTRWLLEEIRSGRLQCTRGDTATTGTPATVTVGGTAGMAPHEVLTISLP